MVVHLAAAAHNIADVCDQIAVQRAAGLIVFLQDMNVTSGHLRVPDKEAGGAQRGKAASDQIGGLVLDAFGPDRACKRFIISA